MRIHDPKLFWLSLYVFINILAAIIMYNTGKLIGDVTGNNLYSTDALFVAVSMVVFSYTLILVVFFKLVRKIKIRTISFGDGEKSVYSKIGFLLIILQILFMAFNVLNGVNTAGSNNIRVDSIFSFFWVLVPVDALFLIFYGVARNNKYFKINLCIYLISNLIRGWAGVFLIVAFMEWCHNYRARKIRPKYVFLAILLVMLLYPVINAIKFYIRMRPDNFSFAGFLDVFDNALDGLGYMDAIYLGVLHIVERIQTTSILIMVIQLKDSLYTEYMNGAFTPFWWEGLHGLIIDKLIGNEKSIPLSVAFTEYGIFNWEFDVGNWNTNTAYASWFFIEPYLIPLYLFYTLFICFLSYALIKKISSSVFALDLLWLIWLLYLLPPWFGTFVQFIYALFIFLILKIIYGQILVKKRV
ncbi:oligosaccharide repeat unit polymerase [Acinetobacter bereziniae]|jgi:hypothetical protein|uniref:oligosaccharide repeat unit polymerase n=1 Tax=Acinetobacter bereziniae TaxID=106648 RepID=UPI0021D06416|nr:oligosaccharide repeat unit polymerase [Acinetobacter bereziniae]MCU4316007.1 oligosaccharide repeat unit polymerase [Acinetobacter bereziniae]